MIALALFLLSIHPAAADWNYGCIGKSYNGDPLSFDRSGLVRINESPEPGEDGFDTFRSLYPDMGLGGPLTFRHPYSGDTIRLVRFSSRVVSQVSTSLSCYSPTGVPGTRLMRRTSLRNSYGLSAPGIVGPHAFPRAAVTAPLDCFDETVTNCR